VQPGPAQTPVPEKALPPALALPSVREDVLVPPMTEPVVLVLRLALGPWWPPLRLALVDVPPVPP